METRQQFQSNANKRSNELTLLVNNTMRDLLEGSIPDYIFTDYKRIFPLTNKIAITIEVRHLGGTHILHAHEESLAAVADELIFQYNTLCHTQHILGAQKKVFNLVAR